MRKLHVVGVSEDGGTLVLADAPGAPGAYTAPVDDRLRAALRRPVRRTNGAGRGSLTPREIQARLRAGAELADVAAEAGLPPERLEAYAAPVLSERARVLEDARAARMSRPQLGPSALPLAAAVGQRLRAVLGGPPEAVRWSASRTEDASWTVQFSYAADGANGSAAWRWDRSAHSLTPLNRAGAELGHVPRQGERPAAPQPPLSARPEAPQAAGAQHAAEQASAAEPVPSAQVAAPGPLHRADGTSGPSRAADLQVDPAQSPTVAVLATAPAADSAASPEPGRTSKAGRDEPVAEAAAPAEPEPAAAAEMPAGAPAAREPAPREPAPREPAPREPAPREPAKPRPRSARRATVPMWADVLLGTTPSDLREAQAPDPGAATG